MNCIFLSVQLIMSLIITTTSDSKHKINQVILVSITMLPGPGLLRNFSTLQQDPRYLKRSGSNKGQSGWLFT